jgi:hypothetical protein
MPERSCDRTQMCCTPARALFSVMVASTTMAVPEVVRVMFSILQ